MRLQLLTLFLLFSILSSYAQDRENLAVAVYFETASAELTPEAQTELRALSSSIQGMGDYRLELAAHTDSRGTDSYNDRLARQRARSVNNFLRQQGVTTDNLEVLTLGESRAGNDIDNDERQQENRRVDVLVQGWYWQGVGSLQDSLAGPLVQTFTLDATNDQIIDGAKGGRFFISANSFITADGSEVSGPIDITLTECYSMGDMISLGLTTTAQERILESGGMLRLTASANGQALELKQGRSIGAVVPTPEFRQDMSLFYGQAHDGNEEQLDWENSEAPVQGQLPRLRLAPAPSRPTWLIFGLRYLKYRDLNNDPRRPVEPEARKPIRPREPNYDKIAYHPKGLQKIFMGKAAQDTRTAEMREKRRQRYESSIERFEQRTEDYHRSWEKYRADAGAYAELIASEVDDQGFVIGGPDYEENKARADADYERALDRYKVDSMRYEKYQAYKTAEYEKQVEALGTVDAGTLSTYFFNINRMGWANIDRFLKETPTTILAAQEEGGTTDGDAMVFLLIPDRNIILRMPYYEEGGFQLRRVPLGEKAKVIALKVQEQKAFIASQEVIITDDLILALNYQPGRLRDIRAELDSI